MSDINDDIEIEIEWGCIGEYDEASGIEPEWDKDDDSDIWECHSCDNGPCQQ